MESSRLLEQLNQFWQKVPQQKLSFVVSLLLVIYCAHVLSNIIWQMVPTEQDKGRIVVAGGATGSNSASSASSRADLSQLLRLNIFGEENKAPAKPKPVVQTQSAPKTRLNVTLTGIVANNVSSTSDTSVAIIESSSGQSTYGINDKIDGTQARVEQILIDRVILVVSGRYETLMLDGIEYSTTVPSSADEMKDATAKAAASQIKARPAAQRETKKETTEPKRMDRRGDTELSQTLREQREEMFSDPKKLMDYIRIRPFRQKGELMGYRLTPGKEPALFKQVGLKHNDLAVNINGYDLTDMQQALSVMKELRSMTEATITVMRDDSPVEIILAL